MIRLLFYVLVVLLLGLGFAWLADRPGDLVITWQDRQIEMSLMAAATAVAVLIGAILLVWWLVHAILVSPQTVSRYFRARKRDRGYQALSTGLIAAGAGDGVAARKMTKRTQGLLSADQEPLIHLLDAQTALIEGRSEDARAKFEAMAEDPETRELGLRGLYIEARKAGANEAARHYAEKAAESAPQLPWAAEATLAYRSAEGNWDDAIRLLEKQRLGRVIDKAQSDRKKAVLLTARAHDRLEGGDVAGARTDGLEANRLAPEFVPAAIIAARALFREDNLRKGSSILEKLWKKSPHPEIAETYVRARPGDSTHDRLKRAQKLESIKRNNAESLYIVAKAALDAHELKLARDMAEAAIRIKARESTYLLLADIEEADTGDQGRVRHWLAQAVRAPRDEAWTADGYVAEEWAAVSPVTGRLDAFEWRVPVEQLAEPIEHAEMVRGDAERAIASLPPVAVPETKETVVVADSDPVIEHVEVEAPVRDNAVAAEPVIVEPEKAAVVEPEKGPDEPTEPEPEPATPESVAEKQKEPEPEPPAAEKPASEADVDVKTETAPTPASAPDPEPVKPEKAAGEANAEAKTTKREQKALDGEAAVMEAVDGGSTHIVTDAVGKRTDRERESAFLSKPPDDPGVDETQEDEEPKSRFRLF
ncbi:heme biosynthesis protein HemY [Hoeflea sp. CAU 1731]